MIDATLIGLSTVLPLRETVVLRVEGDGTIVVAGAEAGEELLCEMLCTSENNALNLAPKDRVLIWRPHPHEGRAIVLGRLGVGHAPLETPETLVLEAKHSITLRVGDGSITIREDGKILIKGNDLVSHAQRVNRIKGGAVSIN